MSDFKYQFGDRLTIVISGETGEVIGQARYAHSEDSFLLRYAQSGKAVETWWAESALGTPAPAVDLPT